MDTTEVLSADELEALRAAYRKRAPNGYQPPLRGPLATTPADYVRPRTKRGWARLGRKREYDAAVRAKVGPEATEKRLAGLK